jgi:hypothetical protein
MAKKTSTEQEAHVTSFGVGEDTIPDAETDEHGLTVLKVSSGDAAPPDPLHAGPEKLGRPERFDPNAALRNKMGVGPGLQDSEVINPAVWVDENSDAAREAAADSAVQNAERQLERVKRDADAVRKGEPLVQEIR